MSDESKAGPDKVVKILFILTMVGVAVFSAVIHLFVL